MAARRFSQLSNLMVTTGRSVILMRSPTSCVTGWLLVALIWQVAQVGAAE